MRIPRQLSFLNLTVLVLIIISCSSTKQVSNWRKPASEDVKLHKVLVLGMTNNVTIREHFEQQLTATLLKNGINAEGSLSFFKDDMKTIPQTMEAWLPYINQLEEQKFDSVLITKVIGETGKDSKSAIIRYYNEFFGSFKEDVTKNKELYSAEEGFKDYTVHRVASNLYCICEKNEEEDLIWKINIDIKQAFDSDYLVSEGLKLFTKEFIEDLKEEEIFVTE
ncbi:hypothetical protein [Mesonia aestuariivivens]|uniref:Lipoprotein n=1 Tax=Mesonia aestuariivivens TaxID=2796128 RepID=A0ABS6VZP6_9FLAO|nr:hypothetical protein [Mesonia aestuariivivens]MBW2960746.1 hypothetical protein [Mesonia aestuariivivens]